MGFTVNITTAKKLKSNDLLFIHVDSNNNIDHFPRRETKVARKKLKRLILEHASLSTTLPLHADSSVFFRVDEERVDVMHALITGPPHTPYAGKIRNEK